MFLEKTMFEIICFTEHWLKDYQMLINYENYTVGSCFNRKSMLHGGSLILIKNGFKFKQRNDIVGLSVEHCVELSCVELDRYVIVCVYRPPNYQNFSLFESVMEDVLAKLAASNKATIVCGDFNINILEETANSGRFLNLFKSFDLSNIFKEPTRVTPTSATCIDNVFCDCNYLEKDIVHCLPSDHSGQTVSFKWNAPVQKIQVQYRPITTNKLNKFNSSLLNKLYTMSHNTDDGNVNQLYDSFFSTVITEFNKTFEKRTKSVSPKFIFSDWATKGIRKSREKLFELYGLKPFINTETFNKYVATYSTTFRNTCKAAKALHISSKIKTSENKIKTVWKVINNETGRKKIRNNSYTLETSGGPISSNLEVAQEFVNFFTDIPLKTTEALNSSPDVSIALLKANMSRCPAEFKFKHINPVTVIKAFRQIKIKLTEDLWGMSIGVCTSIVETIAPYLALIFNLCVDQGVFPDLMKYSKVIPLFKSGDSQDSNNYRPVSVLPVFSKVFEKVMLNQMLDHFNTFNILHDQQYGFTKGRCTTDAGVTLLKHIFTAWEEAQDAIGIFCDLSKAFDCVNHETLLLKLEHYGLGKLALSLVKSYLCDRQQHVQINGVNSHGLKVKMGVPQGSILGPFLFLVYINDLPFLLKNQPHNMVLFADDTSLIFKINRRAQDLDDVNNALLQVHNWFTANNLVLNGKKTKCIRFALPNVKSSNSDIVLNKEVLEFVDKTIFLGITLDSRLQWGPHLKALAGRLSSAAYAVRKIRQFTDVDTARLVYFSYFHSIMTYGILLWGRAADIESIFILQKRAIRAIYNLRRRDSLRDRFKEINIMTVPCQYIYENIMYVRKNLHLFSKRGDRHNYNTRNRDQLVQPGFRLAKVDSTFMGYCLKCYNKIPQNILELNETKFKTCIKRTLCKRAYYKLGDYIADSNAWLHAGPAPQDRS